MFNSTSPVAPAGHPPLFPPGPPSALTTKFLNMIPRTLSGAASPPIPGPHRPVTAEQQAKAMISSHEESEAASWPSPTEAAQWVLPVPTIRIKGLTVMERSEFIVEAAEACGRIYSERAKTLYTFLVAGALGQHVALRPTVKVTPNRMTFFFVVDELPVLLGVCRATIYRAFDDLAKAGLVARRPWFTSSRMGNGGTVTGGVVADVVLSPVQGTEARVRAEYLRQQYRNLDADRHAGRTAWQWITEVKEAETQARTLEAEAEALPLDATSVRQINALRARAADLRQSTLSNEIEKKLNHLLRWTLPPSDSNPVTLTVSARQDAVYRLGELATASPQQRGVIIQERAEALCLATGDGMQNLRFWRWLLWRMTELEHSQPGCISTMVASLMRLLADIQEWGEAQDVVKPLKRAGALFVSRLKSSGWWEDLKTVGVL